MSLRTSEAQGHNRLAAAQARLGYVRVPRAPVASR